MYTVEYSRGLHGKYTKLVPKHLEMEMAKILPLFQLRMSKYLGINIPRVIELLQEKEN